MVQDSGPGNNGPGGLSTRKASLPVIGGLLAVVVIGVAIIAFAFKGGGSDVVAPELPGAGLATGDLPTPEATIDIARPTVVANLNITELGNNDRLLIPKISVDAPLSLKTVGLDGQMPDPNGPDDVAYYDFSAWPGLGGGPGKGGNSVFAGHVDSGKKPCKNGTRQPPCEAVLWDLRTLKLGDEIQVRVSGVVYKYQVSGSQQVNAVTTDWSVYVASTAEESITIITCGGDFNHGEYNNRQVIVAKKVAA